MGFLFYQRLPFKNYQDLDHYCVHGHSTTYIINKNITLRRLLTSVESGDAATLVCMDMHVDSLTSGCVDASRCTDMH